MSVVLPPCEPTNCGKEFRHTLHKPSPNYPYARKKPKIRIVPAFTIQSMQKNVRVMPLKKSDIYALAPLQPTKFRTCYDRGEIPISIEFTNKGKRLSWKVPIEKLDFNHYLPMLFEGMSEGEYPFSFIVEQGINDMVDKGAHKVLPVVPQLIIPIKNAFGTKRPKVICHALKCIIKMVTECDNVGVALVPYYRQILPMLNLFKMYGRSADTERVISRENSIADLISDCLEVLERYGGPDAFINIKYQIPTYESSTQN